MSEKPNNEGAPVVPKAQDAPKAKPKGPKKVINSRLLRNPKQTALSQIYYINGNEAVNVPLKGYHFSKDKAMDKAVDYLKKHLGFIEVKQGE